MDKQKAEEYLNLPKLTKKDSFEFGCNQCGECCRNRDNENAIMLTPLDVYKISKYLNITTVEFIEKYCYGYCGDNSKFPIVILKTKVYRGVCVFSKGKCSIHPVKPAVCALFPLGRMTIGKDSELTYFMQKTSCGNKTKYTVEEWLSEFNMLEDEKITVIWQKKLFEFSEVVRKLCEKYPTAIHIFTDFMFLGRIYLDYDTSKDFLPQFEVNCTKVSELLIKATNFHKKLGGD